MENQDPGFMLFKLLNTTFKCKISLDILRSIDVLFACYKSSCKDNRIYTCHLDISPDAVRYFFTWKKWEIGQIGKPDFTQIVPEQWTEICCLASYLMVNTFFDSESIYYVLPPLYVMQEEVTKLVPEALNNYFSEYLTRTHCSQCTCSNQEIAWHHSMEQYFSSELKIVEKTYDYLVGLFHHLYWHCDCDPIQKEWGEIKKYFQNKGDSLSFLRGKENINSRDNDVFVEFMESKTPLLDDALSFDHKYIDSVSKGEIYNFLQLNSEQRIAVFDYFCYHKHFSQEDKNKYKCKCDFSFYRKWNDFITFDPFIAKLIFDTLGGEDLLDAVRCGKISNQGNCMKNPEWTFDDLVKYIKGLAPKGNTKNISSDEKKRLAREANKRWNKTKFQDPSYLKASVGMIKIRTTKK
jgi:hypothetical protein